MEALARFRCERRYRMFAGFERVASRFPYARWQSRRRAPAKLCCSAPTIVSAYVSAQGDQHDGGGRNPHGGVSPDTRNVAGSLPVAGR